MSVAILYHPGLGTKPNSDLCGAKPHLLALGDAYGVHPTILTWDDPACADMLVTLATHNDFVFLIGHSHGAWRARENYRNLQYTPNASAKIGLGFIDLCPWGNVFEARGPAEKLPEAAASYACWQHHDRWFMPVGVPFLNRATPLAVADDCTDWTDPPLGHIQWRVPVCRDLESIAGDARVWANMAGVFATLLPPAPPRLGTRTNNAADVEPITPPDAPALPLNDGGGAGVPTLQGGG